MKPNRAFIGVSLDSRLFSRSLVRGAMEHILARREKLLLLLAGELCLYNFSLPRESGARLDLAAAAARVQSKEEEFRRFLLSEIRRLPPGDRARIELAGWGQYSDAAYAGLWRRLSIAFELVAPFRRRVVSLAEEHVSRSREKLGVRRHAGASARFILDEMAMCLRVAELGGWPYEYYPGREIAVIGELYAGRFASQGLSVESLIQARPRRVFTPLPRPEP
jgi:hypothetical protein